MDLLWTFLLSPAPPINPSISIHPPNTQAEPRDDYTSTLGKGLHGLADMFRRFPSAKWYAVVGDDVFLDGGELARLLSAFDGEEEEWCFGEAGVAASGQARNLAGGSAWRLCRYCRVRP